MNEKPNLSSNPNVFEWLAIHRNCDDFEPVKCTDEPLTEPFDGSNIYERFERLLVLAARVERGEEVFHDSEKSLEPIRGNWGKIYEERARGFAAGSTYSRTARSPDPASQAGFSIPRKVLKVLIDEFAQCAQKIESTEQSNSSQTAPN